MEATWRAGLGLFCGLPGTLQPWPVFPPYLQFFMMPDIFDVISSGPRFHDLWVPKPT
jgi:hypothetical protein